MYVVLELLRSSETYAITTGNISLVGYTEKRDGTPVKIGTCMSYEEADVYFNILGCFIPPYMLGGPDGDFYDDYLNFVKDYGTTIDEAIRLMFKLAAVYGSGPMFNLENRSYLYNLYKIHGEYRGATVTLPKSDCGYDLNADDELPF